MSPHNKISFTPISNETIGIYIHIPFCRSKCGYCDFYSLEGCETRLDEYFAALSKHITDSARTCSAYSVDTIYFGGGTPTLAGAERLMSVLKTLNKSFKIEKDAEITVEANPATATLRDLKKLRKAGFNRLSVGLQSSNENELRSIGRAHSAADADAMLENAQKAKFSNISVDIMIGLPDQTNAALAQTIEFASRPYVTHVSCYCLKLEKDAPMSKSGVILPSDDEQADLYLNAVKLLNKSGYAQYEISNFARAGLESRHNMKYWNCEEYLGFGPGSHSYLSSRRFSFVRDLDLYISGIYDPLVEITDDNENITQSERVGEYLMLRMRLCAGINDAEFQKRFKRSFTPFSMRLEKYKESGHAQYKNGTWSLTPEGMFISNKIIAELLDAALASTV